jgi:uncharacterized protein
MSDATELMPSAGTYGFDAAAIEPGTNEELAGPSQEVATAAATRPVERQERVASVDVLRGFALLGILLMNITSFGLPSWAYSIPLSTPLPVFSGPHARANTVVWFLRWVLAEGKMRALFSMLFGAGAVLLTSRAEQRGAGDRTADIFTRRNMWLVLIGMLHGYLVWYGDILYWYGLTGLLFLYPCRKLEAKTLIRTAVVVLFLNAALMGGGQLAQPYFAQKKALAADAAMREGKTLTEDQIADLKSWKEVQEQWRPPRKKVDEEMKAMRGGYLSAQGHQAKENFQEETVFYYFAFGDVLAFMLLGMAMYKNGFLSGQWSYKAYALTAAIGLGIAWPLVFEGCLHAWRSHFDQIATTVWLTVPYELGRVGGALGNAAILLMIFKAGRLRWATKTLAAVGQMALSNYLLTSALCKILFVWAPHPRWFGQLEYYQLYYVLAGIWAVNLVWSSIWLKYFRFGPVEWVWRSLTYWKRQPMLLGMRPAASEAVAAAAA